MSDLNSTHNRCVWFDIPVQDLKRAQQFYAKVLAVKVTTETHDGFTFGVLDHNEGNGGCLIPHENEVTDQLGVLIYLNVDGRIKDALEQVEEQGGQVIDPIHDIGPYGCRAIIKDSEGNRIALHSTSNK
ncbi:VOC family protein [Flocculibacter collagenilyticus]|uniref:VOC family protein n=1 Tax=Flocculibacter collagenilyticus TaxID=2744479 RepID=UPI0018F54072|nr:VOC family protein [Flocculibacter collagenilyticus]